MRHLVPVLILALASVVLTWPLVINLGRALPGYSRVADDDLLVNVWSFWWTRVALLEGRGSLLHTPDLFHPVGVTLTLTAIAPAATVPLVPVMAALPGLPGIYCAWDINVLLTFFLSALGAYLLAERVTRAPWAALVAGLAFGFCPYRYEHLRHVNLSCTQWLPFVFLGLWRRLDGGGAGAALLFAMAAALVAASSTTYTAQLPLFGLVFVAAWVLAQADRRAALRRAACALPLPLALGALLAAPVLWPAIRDMISLPFETPVWDDPASFAFPVEGLLMWNRHPYVGVALLGLALYGCMRGAAPAPWAAVALLGLALTPGPVLKTLSGPTTIPLPYALVRYFPGLGQNRFTERFLVFWFLGAAVLAAQALAAWPPFARAPRALALAVGAVLMLDFNHAPLAMEQPAIPPLYAALAEAPPGWPVYEWPADYLSNRRYMFYQMVHQRPLCQGLLSRRPLLSYALEESDAHTSLPALILIVHHDVPAAPHQEQKLAALKRRYAVKPFRTDGPRESFLLTSKR